MKQPWHIVGGGIIGLLSARELHAAGESVVVIDRQTVGQESSWAGGGILSPLYPWRYPAPVSALARWSQGRYPALARDLLARTGMEVEWTPSGMLYCDSADSDQALAWARVEGAVVQTVDIPWAHEKVPGLAPGLGQGLWMPEVAQIRNPRLLSALCADLRQSGVEFLENITVQGFTARQGRLTTLRTNRGDIETQACLVAAGAWSGDLLASTELPLPITPVKGQMLVLSAQSLPLDTLLIKDHHYLIPRRDGRVLVGSTLETSGYVKSTTEAARTELLQAAVEMIPALAGCPVERQWAGLRPGSPTGVPYIGEHPNITGLFVCAGHFRNGIVLAPASARLAADLMLGRAPTLDLGQFQLLQA